MGTLAGAYYVDAVVQLIRKPDRIETISMVCKSDGVGNDYNSLENPIGIETSGGGRSPVPSEPHYNSLENP